MKTKSNLSTKQKTAVGPCTKILVSVDLNGER